MTDFNLGRHEAMIENLDARTSRIEAKLDVVLAARDEQRGERKMLVLIATGAGAAASFVVGVIKLLLSRA